MSHWYVVCAREPGQMQILTPMMKACTLKEIIRTGYILSTRHPHPNAALFHQNGSVWKFLNLSRPLRKAGWRRWLSRKLRRRNVRERQRKCGTFGRMTQSWRGSLVKCPRRSQLQSVLFLFIVNLSTRLKSTSSMSKSKSSGRKMTKKIVSSTTCLRNSRPCERFHFTKTSSANTLKDVSTSTFAHVSLGKRSTWQTLASLFQRCLHQMTSNHSLCKFPSISSSTDARYERLL